jgi:hypothetical protein
LKTIATLRPTWAKPATASQQTAQEQSQAANSTSVTTSVQQQQTTVQAPVAKPATATAPGPTAPPANGGAPVVQNHLEMYTAMNTPGSPNYAPFHAAAYYARYGSEIEAARKSRSAN